MADWHNCDICLDLKIDSVNLSMYLFIYFSGKRTSLTAVAHFSCSPVTASAETLYASLTGF